MNIKEAGALSGVSVRNIRFYEQKGLISPARNPENDYRDYSEDDLDRLKLIRALRMVDMPLETIKEVLCGASLLSDAASSHCANLTGQIKKLETALQFCRELSGGELSDMDELLERMDAADSEKLLPRTWVSDYAEAAKAVLGPLCVGLVPIVMGTLWALCGIWLSALWLPLIVLSTVGYLFCWGWIGYALGGRKNLGRCILWAHIFPAVFLVCGLYYQMLPLDGLAHPFLELGLAYALPLFPFTIILDDYLQTFFLTFVLMLLSFSAGALLARRQRNQQNPKSPRLMLSPPNEPQA